MHHYQRLDFHYNFKAQNLHFFHKCSLGLSEQTSFRTTDSTGKKKEYNLVVVGLMERALIQPEKRIKLEEFSIESRK